MEFFKYCTDEPSSKEQLLTLPHFWSPVCGKDCGLCPHNPSAKEVGGLDGFLYEATQNFEVFKYSRLKLKNQKPTEVEVLSEAYLIIPQPCRSNLARRYLGSDSSNED